MWKMSLCSFRIASFCTLVPQITLILHKHAVYHSFYELVHMCLSGRQTLKCWLLGSWVLVNCSKCNDAHTDKHFPETSNYTYVCLWHHSVPISAHCKLCPRDLTVVYGLFICCSQVGMLIHTELRPVIKNLLQWGPIFGSGSARGTSGGPRSFKRQLGSDHISA